MTEAEGLAEGREKMNEKNMDMQIVAMETLISNHTTTTATETETFLAS